MGSVTPVKALGVLAMIDDGELDWKVRDYQVNFCRFFEVFFFPPKNFFSASFLRAHDESLVIKTKIFLKMKIICINSADPRAAEVNDVEDVER
jgi:hypothetical protein